MEVDEQRVQAGVELMNFAKEFAIKYAALFGHNVLNIHVSPSTYPERGFEYDVRLEIKKASKIQ